MKKKAYILMFKASSTCGDYKDKVASLVAKSHYSHVAVIIEDDNSNTLYESHIDFGTRKINHWLPKKWCWDRYELNSEVIVISRLIEELDKLVVEKPKYSLVGAVLSPFVDFGDRKNKVFCSEFVALGLGWHKASSYTPKKLFQELDKYKLIKYVGWEN